MKPDRIVPVFQVADLQESIEFYTESLGFTEDFRFGKYGGVKLGGISLHLSEQIQDGRSEYKKPLGSGIAYVLCDSVDAYFDQVREKGVIIKHPPQDAPYGMRDFMLADLDGNHLAFGSEIPEA